MLPSDHDAAAALAALSSPLDHSTAGWTRRKFLTAAALAGGGAAAMSVIPDAWREAWAAPPIGATDGVLVLVTMYGGVDGLNAVVPITNGTYYAKRAGVSIAAAAALPIAALDLALLNWALRTDDPVAARIACGATVAPDPDVVALVAGALGLALEPDEPDEPEQASES